MNVEQEIDGYLMSLPEQKRREMQILHDAIARQFSDCRLSFHSGRDEQGKVVSNPNIGYGTQNLNYTDGSTKEFYQIGLSANTSGISMYVMGLKDKDYLRATFGATIGKAKVTSYCINFRKIDDIDMTVLLKAINDGIMLTST